MKNNSFINNYKKYPRKRLVKPFSHRENWTNFTVSCIMI